MRIEWHDSYREPQCKPDANYPLGKDLDASFGADASCAAPLPYPAKRCGYFTVVCPTCFASIAVTTAGRADDPRSVKIACKRERATVN